MRGRDKIQITRVENGWMISPPVEETVYRVHPERVAETQESLLAQIKALTDDAEDIPVNGQRAL